MTLESREVRLRSRLEAMPSAENFSFRDGDVGRSRAR